MDFLVPQRLLLLLIVCVSCDVLAEDSLYIKYGAYLNPPWVIQSDDRLHGITPEYVAEVERRSKGLTIDVTLKPFRRAIVELKEGSVDMIAATDHPLLHRFAEKIAPFGSLQMTLFTKKQFQVNGLQDLEPFKLGILRGLFIEKLFENYSNIELVYVNSEASGFDSVDKGYLDGVAFAEVAYRYFSESKDWPYSHLRQTLFLGEIPVYGWTNKGRTNEPAFIELRRVMQMMSKDGSSRAYLNGVGVDFGFVRE